MFSNIALLRTIGAFVAFGLFATGLVALCYTPRYGLGMIVGGMALGALI